MKTALNTIAAAAAAATLASCAHAGEAQPLTAPGPQGELDGTLIAPDPGKPLVLIIPGSGPTDRDGNNPMGVTAGSYRLLAEALAARGIGSLRIDKRGMFASKAAVPDPNDVTIAAYADDVRAWINAARETTGISCIWLAGHSEGGLVALAAGQNSEGICGVMLIASVGRRASETIREQLQSNPANAFLLDEARAALDSLDAGERVNVEDMNPLLLRLFAPGVQDFLIDLFSYDPSALMATIDLPALIVSGGMDIQTPRADAEALAAANDAARLVIIEDMNHVLKAVEGEGQAANIATYGDSLLPIHPRLVEAIADFLTKSAD